MKKNRLEKILLRKIKTEKDFYKMCEDFDRIFNEQRIGQAIYNALRFEYTKGESIKASSAIEYEEKVRDEKAIIADLLFNISDKRLGEILKELI